VRNLLALLGFAVLIFIGLGWYLGWYTFTVKPGSDGKIQFQGDVNTIKIRDDAQTAKERVGKILQSDSPSVPTDFVGPPSPNAGKTTSSPGSLNLPKLNN
jgi:hypothetical protein